MAEIPIKLDKKDRQIMRQLEEDSRQSYSQIGGKVGLAGDTVEYRMNRLAEAGVIIQLFAEPNFQKLGLKTYRVYLKVENIPENEEQELIAYFRNAPRGCWFAEFQGEWDYTIRYTVRDEMEFMDDMEGLLARFGKYIRSKNVVVTTLQTYLPATCLTGEKTLLRSAEMKKGEKVETLDEIDGKIMFYLFENARMKTVDIASKIGMSSDAVQYRIRKLMDKEIISFYGAYYNSQIFGYIRYKVLFWLQHTTHEREGQLLRYCEAHPNSTYLNKVIGDWDLEVDFDGKNAQEINEIIKDMRNKFSDIIRDYSALVILKEYMTNPFKGSVKKA